MDRDRILLTPGPLTTTLRTKLAMLRDWGSWDSDFNDVTAGVRRSLLNILHGEDTHVVVPLQGSGTFSVEAAVATLVPRDGHVLVLDNGAYCKRAAKLTSLMGRTLHGAGLRRSGAGVARGAGRKAGRRQEHHPRRSSSTARPAPACSIRCSRWPMCARGTARA